MEMKIYTISCYKISDAALMLNSKQARSPNVDQHRAVARIRWRGGAQKKRNGPFPQIGGGGPKNLDPF